MLLCGRAEWNHNDRFLNENFFGFDPGEILKQVKQRVSKYTQSRTVRRDAETPTKQLLIVRQGETL